MDTREAILNTLTLYFRTNKEKYGLIKMGLFGSYVRNENNDDSDIDVGIELKKSNFFVRMQIKEELEKLYNRSVDVISLKSLMSPYFSKEINKDIVYVE
ncbi:MAG: nucleotidyltransferase domain-containing protein [Paludibacteraceae bacterium]|nr:nucleotidyltransferase domain-containing protein [Paludibacteraceae bacterium]